MRNRLLILLVLAALVYGANFWGTSIYVLDEAKNTACAMEMHQSGDWIVPTFNRELRTDKPPLHYYFMMMAYTVFGYTPFAARFFSVLAGILMIYVVYVHVKRNLNESTAFMTALMLVASLQMAIQFHLAVPDPYLILLIVWSLLSLYEGIEKGEGKKMIAFYALCGLAFLTKGLIAIVFPGLVGLIFLFATRQFNWASIKKLKLGIGIPIFLAIALPWYYLVSEATDGVWLEQFFFKHNVGRYTATMEGHRGFPLAPLVIVIVALLPLSAFIIQALVIAWRQKFSQPLLLFAMITVGVIVLFFSFSSTMLPNYPAPAIPFLAIIVAYYLERRFVKSFSRRRGEMFSLTIYLLLTLAVPLAVFIALTKESALTEIRNVAYVFMILPVAAITAIYFYLTGSKRTAAHLLLSSWMITSLAFFYYCYPLVDRLNPVANTSSMLKDKRVAFYGSFNPAYVIKLRTPIAELNSPAAVDTFLRHQDAVLISRKKYWVDLQGIEGLKILFEQKDLFENPTTIIVAR